MDHREGAVYLIESNATLTGNVFDSNSSSKPGGAIVVNCFVLAPVIKGNVFRNNSAPIRGAIHIIPSGRGDAEAVILGGNTFENNTARGSGTSPAAGGAVYVEHGGNLALDSPDSNHYSNNSPDDVFYASPPE